MDAIIITVGDELLIGHTVDTNSAWLGKTLNAAGLEIRRIVSVRDNAEEMAKALDAAFADTGLIIMTGGLGPTKDDITKKLLSDYFGQPLLENQQALEYVKAFIASRGLEMTALNKAQALMPKDAQAIENRMGTAPGIWLEKEGKILVSVPGVPHEMKYIITNGVLPALKKRIGLFPLIHRSVMTQGIPEAYLAAELEEWQSELPAHIHLAYLPSPEGVKMRFSVYDTRKQPNAREEIEHFIKELGRKIPEYIYSTEEKPVEKVLGALLRKKAKTLAGAESCTGGMIAGRITSVPGASEYFKGSVVAYSNEAKQNILKVQKQSMEIQGAVSRAVVEEMAAGASALYGADYAYAVSGVAGPGGGTDEKPVGTVWIAVCGKGETRTEKFQFGNDRMVNMQRTVATALHMLLRMIK